MDIELLKRVIYLMAERLKYFEDLQSKEMFYELDCEVDIDCLIDNYIEWAREELEKERLN